MARLRARVLSPKVALVFKDYASPPNQMKGRFSLLGTPNTLRRRWLMHALHYSADEARDNIKRFHIPLLEQLGSLDNMIMGGQINQNLACIDENIKDGTTLMVSWHWRGDCDGSCPFENRSTPLLGKAKRSLNKRESKPNLPGENRRRKRLRQCSACRHLIPSK